MSYKSGEIYFVREIADIGYSPFVKVGLVNAPRISEDRLPEHQTGNPRKLALPEGHVVKTDLVSRVEAQLHSRFSRFRAGGEWFSFSSDEELNSAIEHAKELALEASAIVPTLLEADRLQTVESNGEVRPSDENLKNLGLSLASAKEKAKLCQIEIDRISEKLKAAAEQGESVPSVTKVFKPKFDQKALESDYPELAQKYLVAKDSWSQRFLLKTKLPDEHQLDSAFGSEVAEIQALINQVESPEDFALLSAPSLWLTKLKALVTWELDILEARLKIECGEFEGIEGVCAWKREFITRTSFDLKSFMLDHLELYLDYLSDEETKTYLLRNRGSRR